MNRLAAFASDIRGATSIEYGMIAMLISIIALAALTSLSGSIGDMFWSLPGAL